MGKKALFGIGDIVTAAVLGMRDTTDDKGNTVFVRDKDNRELPVKESFPLRAPFTGAIIQANSRLEGDGPVHTYKVECPHNDRNGALWVDEQFLTAVPGEKA